METANAQVMNIPLHLFDVGPQVRTKFNAESIAELAADIAENGILQPLVAQQNGDRFKLLIGERRFRALKLNRAETAPAIIATVAASLANHVQLMENIQREDLGTKDLAAAILELWKKEGTVSAVAARVHKSPSWVSKRLALALHCGPGTTALLDAGIKDIELLYQFQKLEKINPERALTLVPAIIDGTIGREAINDWLLDTDEADEDGPAPGSSEPEPESEEKTPSKSDLPDLVAVMKANRIMLGALEQIANFQDLNALYKTRDALKQIASEALANLKIKAI